MFYVLRSFLMSLVNVAYDFHANFFYCSEKDMDIIHSRITVWFNGRGRVGEEYMCLEKTQQIILL